MNIILKWVLSFLKLVGALILVMACLVGVGMYFNYRAEQRSDEFCASVSDGVKLSELVLRAEQLGIRHHQNNYADQHHFMFPGFVFNWSDCIVKAREGTVTQKWTTPAQD